MDTQPESTHGHSSMIVLAPRGDVLFKVGKDEDATTKILVSSQSMSLASPVFEAMFNSGFSEARDLTSTQPKEVSLPDDDPALFTMLCQIAHLKSANLPSELQFTTLADFALLCDKYSCEDAVRPWSRVWVSRLLPSTSDSLYEKLLFATFVLDLPDEFRELTQKMIRDRVESISREIAMHGHSRLPLRLLDHLDTENRTTHANALAALQPTFDMVALERSGCDNAGEFLKAWCEGLVAAKLYPLEGLSLADYAERAKAFEARNIVFSKICRWGRESCHIIKGQKTCLCDSARELQQEIRNTVTALYASVNGYCLDCVKEEYLGEENMECRVPHVT